MRVLLTANASYIPPRGGATRSNLVWLTELASAGHSCRIVCPALGGKAGERRQMRDEDIDREWRESQGPEGTRVFERGGIEVLSVPERAQLTAVFREQVREFRPDWVLVSSEDLGHGLLAESSRLAQGRIVYIAHTPQFFPFGPASWNPSEPATDLVRKAAAVIAIGHSTARYIEEHAGREAAVIHPPIYGNGPYPALGCFDRGLVTMVNPCAVKGISIFAALAGRFPDVGFGALPGWGTTLEDRAALARHRNITVFPNYRDIEDFLRQTRVLLMPSLWYEGFGLSVMEAKLRGVPTISSDTGGLVEASLGTPEVVPVNGIERFEHEFDENAMPKAVLPENDIEPWAAALGRMLSDRAFYEDAAACSRRAAIEFVGSIRPGRFEEFLSALQPGEAAPAAPRRLEALSQERRELLLRKLRHKSAERRP